MKVVILADPVDMQNAGIHMYTHGMISGLQQLDKSAYIALRDGRNTNIIYENEIKNKEFSFPGYRAIRMFIVLPILIRKLKPDIVIETAHFGPFNLPKKIKRVTVIHDLTPIKFPRWHNFHSQVLQRLFMKSILKRASLIITNSENTNDDLLSYYPHASKKSVKIYPGIDPFFKAVKEDLNEIKEPFFLTTGTIEPRKNLPALLDAYQLFREKTQHRHKLVICGAKGWKNKNFFQKLEGHPFRSDIELKGYVTKEELKSLYLKTSAFIYPSLYEGFGFPVAEAMHCGAPCIVSRVSSLTEVGNDAVLYFNPLSSAELALCMDQLASSETLQKELIEKGYEQAQSFGWGKYAGELEKHLQRITKS